MQGVVCSSTVAEWWCVAIEEQCTATWNQSERSTKQGAGRQQVVSMIRCREGINNGAKYEATVKLQEDSNRVGDGDNNEAVEGGSSGAKEGGNG